MTLHIPKKLRKGAIAEYLKYRAYLRSVHGLSKEEMAELDLDAEFVIDGWEAEGEIERRKKELESL